MTWSYTGPDSSASDEVRFLVGDTTSASPLVSDEEITYALGKSGTVYGAAAIVARGIAAGFSRTASSSVGGDISIQFAQRVEAYRKLADELEVRGREQSARTVQLDIASVDPDTSPLYFSTGMQDNAGGSDAGE